MPWNGLALEVGKGGASKLVKGYHPLLRAKPENFTPDTIKDAALRLDVIDTTLEGELAHKNQHEAIFGYIRDLPAGPVPGGRASSEEHGHHQEYGNSGANLTGPVSDLEHGPKFSGWFCLHACKNGTA